MIIGNTNNAVNSEPFIQDVPTMTQDWKEGTRAVIEANLWKFDDGTYFLGQTATRIIDHVGALLKEERNAVLNRAWEYVVKASREEHGSKEDFIKFVNEHE